MSQSSETVPVTVVIPTIGRLEPLRRCLESLAALRAAARRDPRRRPESTIRRSKMRSPRSSRRGVRVVRSDGAGVARARNDGLRAAANDVVLVTDDDCTVAADWVATGGRLATTYPGAIVTGRVLPVGDPAPCRPRRRTRRRATSAASVAVAGSSATTWCFRARPSSSSAASTSASAPRRLPRTTSSVTAGCGPAGRLRYEPALVVEHHDWRSPDELERLYVRYARGEGFFYAKHLRRGDLRMLRFVARDLAWALRGLASGLVTRREPWTDSRRGILRGLPGGFAAGWRVYGRKR